MSCSSYVDQLSRVECEMRGAYQRVKTRVCFLVLLMVRSSTILTVTICMLIAYDLQTNPGCGVVIVVARVSPSRLKMSVESK